MFPLNPVIFNLSQDQIPDQEFFKFIGVYTL